MKPLPEERLATTDELGRRVYLYPAATSGFFRTWRTRVQLILLAFFLFFPWVHWNGRQLLLLDVFSREFWVFGLHLRAHDVPLMLLVVLTFVFAIGFISVLFGRVWCGWACPQTVFIDLVFRRIEELVEGNYRQRRELDQSKFSLEKFVKKTLKFILFLGASLVIAHSFLAYFVGSYEVAHMVFRPPSENWVSFLVVVSITSIILFDFGWFKEQFCVIMCPYGRLQSMLLDNHSLVVAYDQKRGEPRGKGNQGDCVDCFKCVQVCPTGIDIRRGLQMECITCTACIDACNIVMKKTGRPQGLIRYSTQSEISGGKTKFYRFRWIGYGLLSLGCALALALIINLKGNVDITILRAKESPYSIVQVDNAEKILNHFRLEISNQSNKKMDIELHSMDANKDIELVFPFNPLNVNEGEIKRLDFFVRFPREVLKNGNYRLQLSIKSDQLNIQEVVLVGPTQ